MTQTPRRDAVNDPQPPSARTETEELRYILQLTRSEAGTGHFAPRPEGDPAFAIALGWLRRRPLDSFLHQYLLQDLVTRSVEDLGGLAQTAASGDVVLQSLLAETAYLREDSALNSLPAPPTVAAQLIAATPLIFLRHRLVVDRDLHRYWIGKLAANILEHQPLPPAGNPDDPPLPRGCLPRNTGAMVHVHPLAAILPAAEAESVPAGTVAKTVATALDRLKRLDLLVSAEMRHEASLSPIALMRRWRLQRRVNNGRLAYRLGGFMTAYGRGLTLEAARASCLMEIVERYSAFGDFGEEAVYGHAEPVPLVRASPAEMQRAGRQALNPDLLELEAPWPDVALHWRPARMVTPGGETDIWLPAQCVYLFCNLDEPDLFSALGSTGLAAGNTIAEAKRSALLEVIERDAAATTPFDPATCFTVGAEGQRITALLEHYRNCGLALQFQDLTGPLGVPCYKCFVIDGQGRIIKGTGAHLNGSKALISALTETMYPYPNGPPSGPGLKNLPVRFLGSLPDHGSASADADLDRLERLLTANGLFPMYADLTRADLGLPVVRAIVPGLTISADFDRFSRLSGRLAAALGLDARQPAGVDSLSGSQ